MAHMADIEAATPHPVIVVAMAIQSQRSSFPLSLIPNKTAQ
jgi:hypothetical protein